MSVKQISPPYTELLYGGRRSTMAKNAREQIYKTKLEEKRYLQIVSAITGEIFLDKNGKAFLFSNEASAVKFIGEDRDKQMGTLQKLVYERFIWSCYCKGVTGIYLDNKPESLIPVRRPRERLEYANPDLTRTVLLLAETSDIQYLRALSNKHFIVPASVENTQKNGLLMPSLSFSIVNAKGPKTGHYPPYYCTFTDTDIFSSWRDRTGQNFQPLQMEFEELLQVCGEKGFVINPGEEGAIFLPPESIQLIVQQKEENPGGNNS